MTDQEIEALANKLFWLNEWQKKIDESEALHNQFRHAAFSGRRRENKPTTQDLQDAAKARAEHWEKLRPFPGECPATLRPVMNPYKIWF